MAKKKKESESVEVRVRNVPDWKLLRGDDKSSPIEIFLDYVIEIHNIHGQIGVNANKVLMNPDDYGKLYLLFLSYCKDFMGKSYSQSEVDQVWLKCCPKSVSSVPSGLVFLLEGYIYIE